ncbi:MAG: methyltransferase domain-containing protein [Vicinamibacterales bacterium]
MTPGPLRCPFCGTSIDVQESPVTAWEGGDLRWGVLGCECCAYPVIDGIPLILANDDAREALRLLEAGHRDEALAACLGLDAGRAAAFRALAARADATYREMLAVLSPDAEGTYFLYRFSDPTFVMAEALLGAVAQAPGAFDGPVLDVCGGSGHLTRVLAGLATGPVYLADVFFWKLWLARAFTVPGARVVCCDANQPLPFARAAFSAVLLSDAFPYIWQRRLLADELMRAVRPDGVLLMPHLHNALGFNYAQGMALTPAAYADLFAPLAPRLFGDAGLFEQAIAGGTLDLGAHAAPDALAEEPSISLIASARTDVFGRRDITRPARPAGILRLNPLYTVAETAGGYLCTLTFPTDEYADEFEAVRRYLPDTWTTPVDVRGPVDPAAFGPALEGLRRRRILVDVPARYC